MVATAESSFEQITRGLGREDSIDQQRSAEEQQLGTATSGGLLIENEPITPPRTQ